MKVGWKSGLAVVLNVMNVLSPFHHQLTRFDLLIGRASLRDADLPRPQE